jgi:hypothetical protein
MSVTFRLDVNSRWRADLNAEIARYLRKLARQIQNDAERMAAVKTGKLRSSMYHEVNGLTARIGVRNVPYWSTVEFGSGPHIIRPRTKRALHWPGARHPVAFVNHPGTPSQPFLRPALYRRRGAL